MIAQWSEWMVTMGTAIGETGHLFLSFAAGMVASCALPVSLYGAMIALAKSTERHDLMMAVGHGNAVLF